MTGLKDDQLRHYNACGLGLTGGVPVSITPTTLGTSTSTVATPTTTTSTTATSLDLQQHLSYIDGWILAYIVCCRHKRRSPQCIQYSLEQEEVLVLAEEVLTRVYRPTTSICFCVTRPKLREVFAANFRDRIVQHWLCLRLEPLFEQRFQSQHNVSFNCRKGLGVLAAVKQVYTNIYEVSNEYTTSAWIGKFDLNAFFMSIDCKILLQSLLDFIEDNYHGNDKELVKWLTEIIITHEPEKNCKKRGNLTLWQDLNPKKSLFNTPTMIGMPIGNLTSQLFANFYMSFFDEFMNELMEECGGKYVRFVDDFVIVCPTKEDILKIHKLSETFLQQKLHVTLHKDKVYIQHYTKGVSFIGHVIKPHRIYLSNTTVNHFEEALKKLNQYCKCISKYEYLTNEQELILDKYLRSINSFLGFLVHTNSYKIRKRLFEKYSNIWSLCYINKELTIVKVKKSKYAYNEIYRNSPSEFYSKILEQTF